MSLLRDQVCLDPCIFIRPCNIEREMTCQGVLKYRAFREESTERFISTQIYSPNFRELSVIPWTVCFAVRNIG